MVECPICCEPMAYVAAGKCHDLVCWVCVAKMRCLQGDKSCPFCKVELETVVVTASPFTREDKEAFLARRKATDGSCPAGEEDAGLAERLEGVSLDPRSYPQPLRNDKYGLLYASETVKRAVDALFRSVCWHPSCTAGFERCKEFKTHDQWVQHARREHRAVPCNVCLEGRRIFPFEQLLFRPEDLQRHFEEGDRHTNPAIDPHVRCSACDRSCFDVETYAGHVKENHVSCYICDRYAMEGRVATSPAFPSFDELEIHYRQRHYACPECSYVAFRTEEELTLHAASAHGIRGLLPQRAGVPTPAVVPSQTAPVQRGAPAQQRAGAAARPYWMRQRLVDLQAFDFATAQDRLREIVLRVSENELSQKRDEYNRTLLAALQAFLPRDAFETAGSLSRAFLDGDIDAPALIARMIQILWDAQLGHRRGWREGRHEPPGWKSWRHLYPKASPAADILVLLVAAAASPRPLAEALDVIVAEKKVEQALEATEQPVPERGGAEPGGRGPPPPARGGDRRRGGGERGVSPPIARREPHHRRPPAPEAVAGSPVVSAQRRPPGLPVEEPAVVTPPSQAEPVASRTIRSDSDIVTRVPLEEANLAVSKEISFLDGIRHALDAYIPVAAPDLTPVTDLPDAVKDSLRGASKNSLAVLRGLLADAQDNANPHAIDQFLSLRATYYLLTQQAPTTASRDWARRCTTVFRLFDVPELAFIKAYVDLSAALLPQAAMHEEFPALPTPTAERRPTAPTPQRAQAAAPARRGGHKPTTAARLGAQHRVARGLLKSESHFPALDDGIETHGPQSWAATAAPPPPRDRRRQQIQPSPFPAATTAPSQSSSSGSSRQPVPSLSEFPDLGSTAGAADTAGAPGRGAKVGRYGDRAAAPVVGGAGPVKCPACTYGNPAAQRECQLCGHRLR